MVRTKLIVSYFKSIDVKSIVRYELWNLFYYDVVFSRAAASTFPPHVGRRSHLISWWTYSKAKRRRVLQTSPDRKKSTVLCEP
jgi:hypothetical protein